MSRVFRLTEFRIQSGFLPAMSGNEPDFDFLSLLEDQSVDNPGQCDVVAVAASNPAPLPAQPLVPFAPQPQPQINQLATGPEQDALQLPSMVGKVGAGRHGDGSEQNLLTMHMRHVKLMRRAQNFQKDVGALLQDSCFQKDGKLVAVRAKPSSVGLCLKLEDRSSKGNRYSRVVPWSTFFQASYGKLIRSSHLALSLSVSRSTVNFMTNMVGCVYMNQQHLLLSKLIHLAAESQPKMLVHQVKWDETQLLCSVDADKSGKRVRSAWEIMVCRQRLVLVLQSGQALVFRLVLPPIVLLGNAAHDIFYGIFYHPTYCATKKLIDILMRRCQRKIQILESDAASANLRLVAHLMNRNQQQSNTDMKFRMIHVLCQNHQSQLINVSMLAHIGSNLLNRLYGMMTFIRNLGHFMRMRQAVFDWLEEKLIVDQRVMGTPLSDFVTPHPCLSQLVDYLRQGRGREQSDDLEPEPSLEGSALFEKKAAFFLEMFNGVDLSGNPCHVCSHSALPNHSRHCQDRHEAIQKCADALIGLCLGAMPSIPSPNKWTTLFGPLSFTLGGLLIHQWLPDVFNRAFKDMTFAEFDQAQETLDPRLVESLSFHAVPCQTYWMFLM